MKIYIDGQEVLCDKNLTITEQLLATSSVILNNVFPKEWDVDKDYTSNYYFPKDFSKCKIYDINDNLIFAGIVKNTGNISLNPREAHYASVQVLDFKTLLSEGTTLDFVINEKTIIEAINLVVSKVRDYGFVVGNIELTNGDDVIGTYNTLNMTAYDVLQYLSEISGSKWFTRMIDEDTVAIDFYDPTLMPKGTELEYTKEYFEDNNIMEMQYSYSNNDYRNKQIMTSTDTLANIESIDTRYYDGYNNSFNTTELIGRITRITVNGTSKSFATTAEKEMGLEADFYYEPNGNVVESNITTQIGSVIEITYIAIVKGRQVVYNTPEVDRIENQINRNGEISRYETRNDVNDIDELRLIGETYIKYKGECAITLKVKTHDINLWNIGEVVDWNDAPLNELKKGYMVKKKTTKRIVSKSTEFIFYEFELNSSFDGEEAINYFDNQRRKNGGNIELGNFIDRNIDIENTANIIFNNLTIEENSGNALQMTLQAPLIK